MFNAFNCRRFNWDTVSQPVKVNDLFKLEIQPNLPENCVISALFRTLRHQKVLSRIQLNTCTLNRRMPNCTTVVQTANNLFEPKIGLNSPYTFQPFIRLKKLPKSFGIVQLSSIEISESFVKKIIFSWVPGTHGPHKFYAPVHW